MTEPGTATRRTLSTSRRNAILEATLALVVEVGYDRTTMDSVAARAGVGKATIYRWWAGKPELVIDAVHHRSRRETVEADHGSLRADLRHLVDDLIAVVRAEAPVMLGVGVALHQHPELAHAMRSTLTVEEQHRMARVVARAIARGELPDGPMPVLAYEIAPSLIFSRLLLTGLALDQAFATAIVEEVLLPMLSGQHHGADPVSKESS